MKKYISYLLTLALIVPTLVSCTEQLEEIRAKKNTHTVYFSTSGQATKTGLTIDGNMVNPDWRQTDVENVHFFEMETAGGDAAYAVATEKYPSSDNITARFKASFGETMDIIVNPPEQPTLQAGKSASGTNYYYGAVVAQRKDTGNEEEYIFEIPADQNPNDETLKDPAADFLVGFSRKACAPPEEEEKVVDLYFDRVAALGRFAFTNFKGTDEKVKSVKIESKAGLVGYAYYSDITWGDKNAVAFTRTAGPLTLSYGEEGVAVPTGEGAEPFYAYFVVIPDEATITSIEVVTDQYKYTKTPENPVTFTFSAEEFKNIAMDLSTATAEEISNGKVYRKVTAADDLEVGAQYLLVYENVNGAKVFKPIYTTYTSNNSERTIFMVGEDNVLAVSITDDTIISSDFEECEMTLEGLEGEYHFYVASEEHYLYPTNSSYDSGCIAAEEEATTSHAFSISISNSGIATISRTSNSSVYSLCYSEYFRGSSSVSANVVLYKFDDGRTPQTLSFSGPGPFEYDLDEGSNFEEPTLTSASGTIYGNVTYTSSDESIAEVDSEGKITFHTKTGEVVITATAAGDDTHKPASASYTINVSSSKVTTWYKADKIIAGETYMIISNGNALKLDGTSVATVSNTAFTGDSFQYEADDNLKWTTAASSGKFTFKSGSRFLSRSSSRIQTSSSSGAAFSYDSARDYLTTTGSGSTYYLYYDSGWKAATSTHTASLYTNIAPRNLTFSSTSITHDVGSGMDVNEPTLRGASEAAVADVTYAVTGDPKGVVASINATTGAITLVNGKTGTAVITASAPKTDVFRAESVSYGLIVKEGTAPLKYVKVTSTSGLEVGAQYLLVYEGGGSGDNADPKVFRPTLAPDGNTFNKTGEDALAVEITNSTITSNNYVPGHLTLETGYYLKVDAVGRYLYASGSSSGSGTLSAEATASHSLTIGFDGGIVQIQAGSGSNYLVWSTSSSYFSSNASLSGQYSTGICLYKLDEGGSSGDTPQEQELSFPQEAYTAQVGTAFTAPTVDGAHTAVTYSAVTEPASGVITIDPNSGAVTLVGPGTATITATAEAGTVGGISYAEGSAQYTLEVSEPSGDMVTIQLKKATRITAGKQYVLVSNGKALVRNGEAASAADFNSGTLTVTLPSTSEPNLWWTLGTTTDSNNRGNIYQFTNGGYYFGIVMDKTNNPYTYHIGLSTTTSNVEGNSNQSMPNHNIDLQGYVFYKGSSSSQYIYYDGSSWNNHPETNGTFVADYKTTLYVLDDGSADPTTTYYLASSIEAGKQYLIVSNGKALQNNGGTAAAIDVTVSDGAIQFYDEDAATSLWTATADGEKFNFSNKSQYLVRNSGNVTIGDKSGTTRNNQWTYNSGNQQLIVSGTSSSYYLSYSTSNSKWSIGSSGNATLYTTDPGSGGSDDPTPTQFTYTQITSVSELTDGASYLIVSSDANSYNGKDHQTLFAGDEAGTAVAVSASSGTITGDYSNYEFVISKSGSDYVLHGPNGYVTGNSGSGSRYIQVSSNQVTMSLTNATELNAADNKDGLVTNAFYFYYTKNASKEVLYLNSDGMYKIGGSGRKYGVYLYKKVENL